MKREEEEARRLYPDKEGINGICTTWLQRNAYMKGYEQAKKDMAIDGQQVLYYGLQGSVGLKEKKCSLCGEAMQWQDDRVYLSDPPMYGFKCPKCGNVEYEIITKQ